MKLEGRVALVTGASQGIGRACALALAREGATVAVAARNRQKLDDLVAEIAAAGGKASAFVINVTSVFGQIGQAGQANYAASKAGLIGLTMAMAREVASRNITCNAVAPGFIETSMTAVLSEELKQTAVKMIPLGRVGAPQDVANAVSFLASEEAAYITGHVLNVNGGMLMG